MSVQADLREIATHFQVPAGLVSAEPFGGGHINESFRLAYRPAQEWVTFLLQRINTDVFRRPVQVMQNIRRVTDHIRARLLAQGVADVDRRVVRVVPTVHGDELHCDDQGGYWRMYHFIDQMIAFPWVETPQQAEAAGRAFGAFHGTLADWAGPRLHETIPNFHDTPLRYQTFDRILRDDRFARAAEVRAEVEFAQQHRAIGDIVVNLFRRGEVPERIVHNDAKLNNVLIDERSGEGMCVVDLDTVMPGLSLFDFGDMMRSSLAPAAEDETDLARVEVRMELFEGLARGYVPAAGALLNAAERAHLVQAGLVITLEQGVRFLTDYLDGDRYYRTSRLRHNLDRCRNQFKLFESIQSHAADMKRIIDGL